MGGQRVVNSISKIGDLIESNGKNPSEGAYIFYYDYVIGNGKSFCGNEFKCRWKNSDHKSIVRRKKEKYDEENKNIEYYYYTIKENPDYKAAQEILTAYKKRFVLEKEFPFYEEQADGGQVRR